MSLKFFIDSEFIEDGKTIELISIGIVCIVLCQLFGTMMELPKGFPMYTMDLKQWCKQLGDPELPAQGKGLHDVAKLGSIGMIAIRLLWRKLGFNKVKVQNKIDERNH